MQCDTAKALMSALGQKQTFWPFIAMSALPPKADIGSTCQDVRFVPKGDQRHRSKRVLIEHLVRSGEQRLWYFHAERLSGVLIFDHQLELDPGPCTIPAIRPPFGWYRN